MPAASCPPLSSCHSSCGACAKNAKPPWLDDAPAYGIRRGATPARLRLRYTIEPDVDDEYDACARALQQRIGAPVAEWAERRTGPEFVVTTFDWAQHVVDMPILAGLRQLARRLGDAWRQQPPDLHVLPALPLTSFVLEDVPGGDMRRHTARMDRLAARLGADHRFRAGRPFLLVYPSDHPRMHLGARLMDVLLQGGAISRLYLVLLISRAAAGRRHISAISRL